MSKTTKELIGLPACLLLVILATYAFIKLIKSLPSPSTDEGILGGMLLIGFLGVPLFFGTLVAIVALCLWVSTTDKTE